MPKGYKKYINSCDGIYDTSLDVRFTKHCDNNCSFCIEKSGLDSLSVKPNVSKMIESTKASGKQVVLILGGEPFLYPKELLEYVAGIRESVKEIYITTSLPKTFFGEEKETVFNILKTIDCLNVSLQHYDSDKNNGIFQATSKHNRIDLLKILNYSGFANKIRVSINLVKGFIDTKEDLLYCLNMLAGLSCTQVKINELQHSEDLYISFEDIMGVELPSPYAHGCQKEVPKEVFQNCNFESMKIILKRACFVVESSRPATLEDYEKAVAKSKEKVSSNLLVLYENGELSNGWLSK